MKNANNLLEIKDLKTQFFTDDGIVRAVDGVSFDLERGKITCIVGESGCGKSITARSILQIVDPPGRVVEGKILFHRTARGIDALATGNGDRRYSAPAMSASSEVIDLAALDPRGPKIREIRGKDIAMIFQEPMTSLSPIHTIGDQISEVILLHMPITKEEAKERTIEMLRRVGIPRPADRFGAYTFQLSGGMRQRAMIAMALSCSPSLLIADEPTTALDVTTQAQILDLMLELKAEFGMSILFITHDLGVVAEMADDVVVMYLGTVAEKGDVDSIFHNPKHPYTQALLRSIPKLGLRASGQRLNSIQGMVPDPYNRPAGCPYHPRCDQFMAGICDQIVPPPIAVEGEREVRCLLYGGAQTAPIAANTMPEAH
jgi:peptide/nickel transport system ATP-binding protein